MKIEIELFLLELAVTMKLNLVFFLFRHKSSVERLY